VAGMPRPRRRRNIADEFEAVDATGDAAPEADYNVAPTKPVLAVVQRHPRDAEGAVDSQTHRAQRACPALGSRAVLGEGSVGGVPHDQRQERDRGGETGVPQGAGRPALPAAADGWYEWRRGGGSKQPYFITGSANGTPVGSLAMAGVWRFWRSPDGEPLVTAAVLTTDAVGPLADIHDRMPLLLAPEDWANLVGPGLPSPA